MTSTELVRATTDGVSKDAVAAAALTVVRRALVEGVPVSRDVLAREASVTLGRPPAEAMHELDTVAQQLGVSALS